MSLNPFDEFDEKEQWIIFIIGGVIGVLVSIAGVLGARDSGWGVALIGISIGLTISAIGYAAALFHKKLSILAKNIDLQISKNDSDKKQIAEHLENIIEFAKDDAMKKKVRKILCGAVQLLELKGIEEKNLRAQVLDSLMKREWKKSIAVSAYGSPMEWIDPYWFTYLSLQIGRAAELKQKGIVAKRYFIYDKNIVEDHIDELKLLVESHDNYILPFLFYKGEIIRKLRDGSIDPIIMLPDFNFIEYNNGDKKILWRNPRNQGEVEIAARLEEGMIIDLVMALEQVESELDRKGVLTN